MRGDRDDGHARAVAIEQAVDEMEVAGAAASRADGEFAGDMRVGAGGERRDLLMADMQPLDPAAMAPQRSP